MENPFEAAIFIFQLLIIFQFKHYLADYVLQNRYMLGKFKIRDWELPLLAHVSVHGAMTFAICMFYVDSSMSMTLAMFDMAVHFTVDRIKASPFMFGRYKPTQWIYWLVLGADQAMHHITHYIIIFVLFFYMHL